MDPDDSSSENEPLIVTSDSAAAASQRHRDFHDRCKLHREFSQFEIVAIFVVAFDTVKGNIVEWCKPDFMREQLAGLEFKALPSGAHKLDEDEVYFYEADLYGVACYSKLRLDSSKERGVRMKSVGILTQTQQSLHCHRAQLSLLVNQILINPGKYQHLEEYYEQWTGDVVNKNSEYFQRVDLSYPADTFNYFLMMFGWYVFVLWKAILLQKRILIYNQPPANLICDWVHCATFMKHEATKLRPDLCVPFYYVNIADCDILSRQISYIACTTEKVFETKTELYDLYLDGNDIRVVSPQLKPVLRVTRGDKERLHQLYAALRQPQSVDDSGPYTVEDDFYAFFSQLNSSLAKSIHRLELMEKTTLSTCDLKSMNIHKSDALFLNELLDSMNIDMAYRGLLCCDFCCG